MRYVVAASVAVLIAAPAAVAGPDALSIAKRALRLAKEPPAVTHVYSNVEGPMGLHQGEYPTEAVCPRGMVPISAVAEDLPAAISLRIIPRRRSGRVVYRLNYPYHGPGITVTCLRARIQR